MRFATDLARAPRAAAALGLPLRVGGLLIDLTQLNQISVDPANRTASVEPHLSNREVIRALAPHGLAFPMGHCPTVKACGFLLSGGIGWNSYLWGPTCLSVVGLDLVTADGRQLHASASENSDLYWAARGGGAGFFAVATRYPWKLYPLPRATRACVPTPKCCGRIDRWRISCSPCATISSRHRQRQ